MNSLEGYEIHSAMATGYTCNNQEFYQ